jgi:DNA-binding CsgD family transcriptional regulator
VNRELLRLLSQAVTVPAFLQLAEDEARALLLREGREALAAQRGQTVRAIRELQLKRERLTRGYVAGVIAEVDFRKLGSEISADLERNEAELGELERRLANQQGEAALLTLIREKLPRLPEIWEVLLPEERRQLIRDLTEFVVIERQSTGHALLRVKVPFLPELQAWLGHGKSRAAGFAGGVAGLTPRELAYLCLLSEGQTPPQIRARWTSNTGHIYNLKKSLLRRLGVESLEEAIDLARERFLAERERLPLDASSSNSRGVWHPTERQRIQQVLEGYGRGLDREAICAELGLRPHTVRVMEWRARKLCGVKTLEEVLEGFSNGAPLPEG